MGSIIFEGIKIITSCVCSVTTAMAVSPVFDSLIPEGLSTGKQIAMSLGTTAMTATASGFVYKHVSDSFDDIKELFNIGKAKND